MNKSGSSTASAVWIFCCCLPELTYLVSKQDTIKSAKLSYFTGIPFESSSVSSLTYVERVVIVRTKKAK